MESAVTRIELLELQTVVAYSQLLDGIKSRIQPLELKSAVTRIQPPELKSAAIRSQDGLSLKSDPGAGARASRRMESVVTRIQPLKLELAAG